MKKSLELFWVFFKLGLFTFGGGYAMIPQIKEIVIEKKKWLTLDEVLELIAIAESTPGPIAINMATYIGYKQNKFWGSLFATFGIVIPSFVIIFLISLFFNQFLQIKYVQDAFMGIKCCVAFLIFKAGLEMIIKLKKNFFNYFIFFIISIIVICFEIFSVECSSLIFIIVGGILNIFIFSIQNAKKKEVVK